jgi:hypothetical protein
VVVAVAFATVQDMEDRSQGEITTTTHPFLAKELDNATLAIQAACRWHVAPEETHVHRRISRWPRLFYIPAMRIQSLTSVIVNGVTYDPTLVEFDENTGETNIYGRAVEVEYVSGFDPVPEDLVVLTLELAAGALGVALGVTQESAGSVSVTMARKGGGVTLDDLGRLSAYRLGPLP